MPLLIPMQPISSVYSIEFLASIQSRCDAILAADDPQ